MTNQQPTVRDIHTKAMNYAQDAYVLLYHDDDMAGALPLYCKAARMERQAWDMVPKSPTSEPTLSILNTSASSLEAIVKLLENGERPTNQRVLVMAHDAQAAS